MFNPIPKRDRPKDFGITDPKHVGTTYINVVDYTRARANEINVLLYEVSDIDGNKRAFQSLPRHSRRRAASHDIHRVPAKLRCRAEKETINSRPKTPEKKQKRWRRRRTKVDFANRTGALWLQTHIWHAKRFHMETLWGFKLPRTATQKNSRSIITSSCHVATIQDTSYHHLLKINLNQSKDQSVTFDDVYTTLITSLSPHFLTGDSLSGAQFKFGSKIGHSFLFLNEPVSPVKFFFSPQCCSLFVIVHPSIQFNFIHTYFSSFFPNLSISNTNTGIITVRGAKSSFLLNKSLPTCQNSLLSMMGSVTGPCLPKGAGFLTVCGDPRRYPLEKSVDELPSSRPFSAVSYKTPNQRHSTPTRPFSAVTSSSLSSRQSRMETLGSPPRELRSIISDWKFDCPSVDFSQVLDFHSPPEPTSSINQRRMNSGVFHSILTESKDFPGPPSVFYQLNSIDSRASGSGFLCFFPIQWTSTVWNSLVNHGGKAIGFEDEHSICTELGELYFPFDYPYTRSGILSRFEHSKTLFTKYEAIPPGKRVNYFKSWKFPFWNWTAFVLISVCWKLEYFGQQNSKEIDWLSFILGALIDNQFSKEEVFNSLQMFDFDSQSLFDWISFDCQMVINPLTTEIPISNFPSICDLVAVSVTLIGPGKCPSNSTISIIPNGVYPLTERITENCGKTDSKLFSSCCPSFTIVGFVTSGIVSIKKGQAFGVGYVVKDWFDSFTKSRIMVLTRHSSTNVYRTAWINKLS
ncbi:hypothetical protein P9112_002092 [Eukaryota sp. TZLM1-RC]